MITLEDKEFWDIAMDVMLDFNCDEFIRLESRQNAMKVISEVYLRNNTSHDEIFRQSISDQVAVEKRSSLTVIQGGKNA